MVRLEERGATWREAGQRSAVRRRRGGRRRDGRRTYNPHALQREDGVNDDVRAEGLTLGGRRAQVRLLMRRVEFEPRRGMQAHASQALRHLLQHAAPAALPQVVALVPLGFSQVLLDPATPSATQGILLGALMLVGRAASLAGKACVPAAAVALAVQLLRDEDTATVLASARLLLLVLQQPQLLMGAPSPSPTQASPSPAQASPSPAQASPSPAQASPSPAQASWIIIKCLHPNWI
ncbi:hypothetical protein CYMTET_36439 [Cymbomonas tetramitiformis]|uniref:Uncharacterized protein n=1 Tax=Cymbomonas tetramitiformis TaxID=36881 RepID=A0AAE0CHP5_9CHLO|nr:hypothetical protein CYMTET_36439 [Cymbomonas tetramitiformis]